MSIESFLKDAIVLSKTDDLTRFDLMSKLYETYDKELRGTPEHIYLEALKLREESFQLVLGVQREVSANPDAQIFCGRIVTKSPDTPISKLGFSVRVKGMCKREGIEFLGELVGYDETTLLRMKQIGQTSFNEINSKLHEMGYRLGPFNVNYVRPKIVSHSPDTLVSELGLSVRSANCLEREGIVYLGELAGYDETTLKKFPNLGKTSFREIKQKLTEMGYSLGSHNEKYVRPENI